MNPNQQPYVPPPNNPYDFITNSGKPPRRPLLGGDSMMKRLVIVLGGAFIFIIIAMIISSVLSNGSNSVNNSLKNLVAQQAEIVRIADIGAKKAQSQDTRSLAVTTQLSVMSQQQQLQAVLEERGVKVSKEELAAEHDAQVDELFEIATTNNRFDETFNAELKDKLAAYAEGLQTAYDATNNEATRSTLSESFVSVNKLFPPAAPASS